MKKIHVTGGIDKDNRYNVAAIQDALKSESNIVNTTMQVLRGVEIQKQGMRWDIGHWDEDEWV